MVATLAAVSCVIMLPASAFADGPIAPAATDYLARITHAPAGVQAQIVDGYISIWMRVPAGETVVVRDYRGAPFARFNRAGVEINLNSEEYYLNQVPVPELPPPGLTANTPPRWHRLSSSHTYVWREGRLHSLAAIALAPGQNYVGNWSIAMTVDGRATALRGGIWHTGPPSILWFWPVLVLLACALAAWRVRSPELDRRIRKLLTLTLLALIAVAMAGRYLHGRPIVGPGNVVLLLAIFAAVLLAARRVLLARSGVPVLAGTAIVALWAGLTLITVLTHGYVLIALPAFIARSDVAGLLGGSLSLTLVGLRALDRVAV